MNDVTIPNTDSLNRLYNALRRVKRSKQWRLAIYFAADGLTLVICLLLILIPRPDERWTLLVLALSLSVLVVFVVRCMFIREHFHHDRMVITITANDSKD